MVKIAPSILTADFKHLGKEIQGVVQAGADYIHVDVMDGKFVKNQTPGMEMYKTAKQVVSIPVDTHLMVEDPEKWINEILNTQHATSITQSVAAHGVHQFEDRDIITFHREAVSEEKTYQLINQLHESGIKAGIAMKPNTPVEEIIAFLPIIDMVLVMTVEPGYGGQKMIASCLDKVKEIRKLEPDLDIEVDGGMNIETVPMAKEAGANIIVAGTSIFKAQDKKEIIQKMKK